MDNQDRSDGPQGGLGDGGGGGAATAPSSPQSQESDTSALFTDPDFMIQKFKIVMCPNLAPHDWKACPWLHPAERARRRPLDQFTYAAEMCSYARDGGACALGDACTRSHNAFEMWCHPDRFRTQLCKDGRLCDRRVCFFAHGSSELRVPPARSSAASAARAKAAAAAAALGSPKRRSADAGSGEPAGFQQGLDTHSKQQQQQQQQMDLIRCLSNGALGGDATTIPRAPSPGLGLWQQHTAAVNGGGAVSSSGASSSVAGGNGANGVGASSSDSPLSGGVIFGGAAGSGSANDPGLDRLLAALSADPATDLSMLSSGGLPAWLSPKEFARPAPPPQKPREQRPPSPYKSWEEAAQGLRELLVEAEICRQAAVTASNAAMRAHLAAQEGAARAAALAAKLRAAPTAVQLAAADAVSAALAGAPLQQAAAAEAVQALPVDSNGGGSLLQMLASSMQPDAASAACLSNQNGTNGILGGAGSAGGADAGGAAARALGLGGLSFLGEIDGLFVRQPTTLCGGSSLLI